MVASGLRLDGKLALRQDFLMNCKGLIVAMLILATPLCAIAERGIVSNSKDVTFSIISPRDGSLWIATASHGIIRLGATGRTFAYSAANGDFPCDSIAALAFSPEGVLYMKDARGGVYSYTTLAGFTTQSKVPGDVVFVIAQEDDNQEITESDLPTAPAKNHPTWLLWLLILTCCCGIAYYRIRRIRADHESEVPLEAHGLHDELENESVPEIEPKKPVVETAAEVPQPVADPGFVARVEEIVAANFTDPGYSVETMADALGITRVHLNRKLKEAGAPAPKIILKKARMDKALAMLREGLPVSDVYAACGFSSASYFSSAFKEYFGYTPSDVTKPNL